MDEEGWEVLSSGGSKGEEALGSNSRGVLGGARALKGIARQLNAHLR